MYIPIPTKTREFTIQLIRTLDDILRELEAKALVKETLCHTLDYVEVEQLIDKLTDSLLQAKTKALGKTLNNLLTKKLVNTLADKVVLAMAQTLNHTLTDVEAKPLVDKWLRR